jgi:twitching motility protein PilT
VLDLDGLLRFAVEQGASDVHVKVGSRPRLRVDGRLREGPFDTVEPADTERLAAVVIPRARIEAFQATNECDFMYGIPGLGRFRVSAFRQRGWVGLVLRRVLPGIPSFDALGLPDAVATLAQEQHGLVLVTGLAGSGKTATMAAMVDHVNAHREGHIITVEDPVEVLHPDKRSIVDQREVGTDTPSAVSGLEHALRQDPDVIVLGDLADADAAWAVLQAGEIGHFVLAGMSTVSAVDTIDRFIELFPPHRQRQARAALAATLRGIVSQRLLPRAGGRGRVPAVEILTVNARVRERIADAARLAELDDEMAHGDLYGMQTLDQSLVHLYRNGLVAQTDAIAHANAPSEMRFSLDRADAERERAVVAPAPVPSAAPAPAPIPVAVPSPSA